jgi:hypothetical protein
MTFSPGARERAAGGRRQSSRTRSLSAKQREAQGADVQVPLRMVKVRVPGKRSAQEVPEEERQQSLAQANDRMNSGGGRLRLDHPHS